MISKMIAPSFCAMLGMAQISCSAARGSLGVNDKIFTRIKRLYSLNQGSQPKAFDTANSDTAPGAPLLSSGATSLGDGSDAFDDSKGVNDIKRGLELLKAIPFIDHHDVLCEVVSLLEGGMEQLGHKISSGNSSSFEVLNPVHSFETFKPVHSSATSGNRSPSLEPQLVPIQSETDNVGLISRNQLPPPPPPPMPISTDCADGSLKDVHQHACSELLEQIREGKKLNKVYQEDHESNGAQGADGTNKSKNQRSVDPANLAQAAMAKVLAKKSRQATQGSNVKQNIPKQNANKGLAGGKPEIPLKPNSKQGNHACKQAEEKGDAPELFQAFKKFKVSRKTE